MYQVRLQDLSLNTGKHCRVVFSGSEGETNWRITLTVQKCQSTFSIQTKGLFVLNLKAQSVKIALLAKN